MPTRRDIVTGYIRLPHVVPIIAVLSATAIFAVIASGGWPGMWTLLSLLGAMLGGQLAVGATNELVDADLDARENPRKPIPAGLVTVRGARTMAIAGLVMMAVFSLPFPFAAFALCALGNGIGVAYSLWLKHTPWSWVAYAAAIPLLPVWVWTALDAFPARLLAVFPLAIPAIVSLQIAQSLPDIEGDRRAGVRTLAVQLGKLWALTWCWAGVAGPAVLASAVAPWLASSPVPVWTAGTIALGLVAVNIALVERDAIRGTLRCFPLMAAAVIVLGTGWTVAMLGG